MGQPQSNDDGEALALAGAGLALACPYSSSDEYEAAIIAERRRTGAYGSRWPAQQIWLAGAAMAALLLLIALL
jgi:hypothetical protein